VEPRPCATCRHFVRGVLIKACVGCDTGIGWEAKDSVKEVPPCEADSLLEAIDPEGVTVSSAPSQSEATRPAGSATSIPEGFHSLEELGKWSAACASKPEESKKTPATGTKGLKFDQGKPRTDLLPPDALLVVADILGYGAGKYGDRNWEKGIPNGQARLVGAILRHLLAHMGGSPVDEESGRLHLAHVATVSLMLLSCSLRGLGEPDGS